MKKMVNFIKANWMLLALCAVVLFLIIAGTITGIRYILDASEPMIELTQEEFELELIHIELQKHYGFEYFQRLDYEIIDVTKENETYKVYLVTYLACTDEGRNEIRTYAATVEQKDDWWDVDTEVVYYK